MDTASRVIVWVLVAVHLFLLAWAVVGLAEFVSGSVIWPGATNPGFPDWMLLAQWAALMATALIFLLGYQARWRAMPEALAASYVVLGALCAYQTFFLLHHDTRFLAMAAEYAAYIAIVVFLYRSKFIVARLGT